MIPENVEEEEEKTMTFKRNTLRVLGTTLCFAGLVGATGCEAGIEGEDEAVGEAQDAITDVPHTPVERQSIGNCWLYAEATWVESMNLSFVQAHAQSGGGAIGHTCANLFCEEGAADTPLAAGCMPVETDHAACLAAVCEEDAYCCETDWDDICVKHVEESEYAACNPSLCEAPPEGDGPAPEIEELDVSQSYWTYWHWFDEITGFFHGDEIQTGGNTWTSHGIIRDRGVMKELDFVPEDSDGEMSNRQSSALNKINNELKNGALKTQDARRDGKLVRQIMDDAWGLSDEVRAQLDQVFGEDGEMTLRSGSSLEGTNIVSPNDVPVRYAVKSGGEVTYKDTNLSEALSEWDTVRYPSSASSARSSLKRVQQALHASQPVVITWDVEFNAMENGNNERRGSFNKETLDLAGKPGSQGGHMTVLEDYAAITSAFGLLEAGTTLDPNNAEDAAKLDAALADDTEITLLRTKNSWGGARPDRAFAEGFPGYHDLWMDYLNGPIQWCPSQDNPTNDNCRGESRPLRSYMLPPGF